MHENLLATKKQYSHDKMFKVADHSSDSRKVQHGIRDLKISKWKCFHKAFVEAVEGFCTTSSFAPLRIAFKQKRHKLDV